MFLFLQLYEWEQISLFFVLALRASNELEQAYFKTKLEYLEKIHTEN